MGLQINVASITFNGTEATVLFELRHEDDVDRLWDAASINVNISDFDRGIGQENFDCMEIVKEASYTLAMELEKIAGLLLNVSEGLSHSESQVNLDYQDFLSRLQIVEDGDQ